MAGKPNVISPVEVKVGDIIEATMLSWGTARAEVEVIGTVGDSGGKRSEHGHPVFALGKAVKECRDGSYVIAAIGDVVPLYWPSDNQMEVDLDGINKGRKPRHSPVLIERPDTNDEPLADWEKDLLGGSSNTQITLRNPDVLKFGPANVFDCDAGGCEGVRARWFYPRTMGRRCAPHRDKSQQSANDPPALHETYVAWEDDPMDARYFA